MKKKIFTGMAVVAFLGLLVVMGKMGSKAVCISCAVCYGLAEFGILVAFFLRKTIIAKMDKFDASMATWCIAIGLGLGSFFLMALLNYFFHFNPKFVPIMGIPTLGLSSLMLLIAGLVLIYVPVWDLIHGKFKAKYLYLSLFLFIVGVIFISVALFLIGEFCILPFSDKVIAWLLGIFVMSMILIFMVDVIPLGRKKS